MSSGIQKNSASQRNRRAPGKRAPLWRRLAKAAPVILAISLSIQILEHVGWLDRFETASIDAFNILQPPHDPSYVIVVGINDDDYHSLFGGVSPLDYRKLQNVLAAIAGGHPRVIGIDLDTSWEGFQKIRVPKEWPSLVWGQDATQVGRELRPIPLLGCQKILMGLSVATVVRSL